MLQLLLFGCVLFPCVAALVVAFTQNETMRRTFVVAGVLGTALAAVGLALHGSFFVTVDAGHWLGSVLTILDFALLAILLYVAVTLRHRLCLLLVLAQVAGLLYLDFGLLEGPLASSWHGDPLALMMVLVVSLVGGVICIYGLGYMREHEEHLHLKKTRQPRFFFFLLLFLGAMNGLVLSDSLSWLFFFWEVTTLCSFMLISHDGHDLAKANATRALWMNLVGGVAFMGAILLTYKNTGTVSVQEIIQTTSTLPALTVQALLPLALLCLAGFSKSALAPFQSWLCGAMVAPTPVSALLHSSTMVKAGVYLLLRLSPAYADTALANIVALLGAFTFMAMAALAVGQTNGKKILAYSTILNLGLITTCAGVGNSIALTAGMLLILFHAVAKALLFLCVGATELRIGSRDIEDMRGLAQIMPLTAIMSLIGIACMMLPPFGALMAKIMALQAAATATAYMPILVVCIGLGSALTLLIWGRWAGTLFTNNPVMPKRYTQEVMDSTMSSALKSLGVASVILSLLMPFIYMGMQDSVRQIFGSEGLFAVESGALSNGIGLFAVYPLFVLLGLGVYYAFKTTQKARANLAAQQEQTQQPCLTMPYLSGIQATHEGQAGFYNALGQFVPVQNAHFLMEQWFGEARLEPLINTIALVLLALMVGGLL